MNLNGTWKLEGISGQGKQYSFTYEFINNDFTRTDNITGQVMRGTFVLDDKIISFKMSNPKDEWVQEYFLTDKYLDLKRDDRSHISGKFINQSKTEII
jgi:hypothetical protein